MISADKAREFARRANFNTIDEQLRYVFEDIREAARDGKYEFTITTISCAESYDQKVWLTGARHNSEDWQKVEKVLKDKGFNIKYYFMRPGEESVVISW